MFPYRIKSGSQARNTTTARVSPILHYYCATEFTYYHSIPFVYRKSTVLSSWCNTRLAHVTRSHDLVQDDDDPNLLRVKSLRRFGEMYPDFLHACSLGPRQPVNEPCFSFLLSLARYLVVLFWGIYGVEASQVPGEKKLKNEKKKKTFSLTCRLGLTDHACKSKQ